VAAAAERQPQGADRAIRGRRCRNDDPGLGPDDCPFGQIVLDVRPQAGQRVRPGHPALAGRADLICVRRFFLFFLLFLLGGVPFLGWLAFRGVLAGRGVPGLVRQNDRGCPALARELARVAVPGSGVPLVLAERGCWLASVISVSWTSVPGFVCGTVFPSPGQADGRHFRRIENGPAQYAFTRKRTPVAPFYTPAR